MITHKGKRVLRSRPIFVACHAALNWNRGRQGAKRLRMHRPGCSFAPRLLKES